MTYKQETMEIWEKFLYDPRPFIQVCEEHGLPTIEAAYRRFSEAGLDWRSATRSKTCPICGATFAYTHGSQNYCGKVCAQEAAKKRARERDRASRRKPKNSESTIQSFSEILRNAQKAGMSYGQYVSAMQNSL